MSTDYAAKERTFVASLVEETGRDLAGWMSAIDECGCNERNAVIDWLRFQGFQFSRASWLERIHHNGGRLIYADEAVAAEPEVAVAVEPKPVAQPEPSPPVPPSAKVEIDAGIEKLLTAAKGLRPLAQVLLNEIQSLGGPITATAEGSLIMISTAYPVAAMAPGAKRIRLYGDFGPRRGARVVAAEPAGKTPPPFPDMIVLDDVRSIDAEFRALLRIAVEPRISKTA